jgi:hypothetical protein
VVKASTDWEAIEREYRAGQLSVREIALQHSVSHTAINKRAKADGWTRDLAKEVRREVSNRLVRAEVSAEVSNANAKEAVETAAARGVELVRQHRRSLGRAQAIAEKLLFELERGTDNIDDIEAAIDEETAADKSDKRRNMMLKAVSLSSRAQIAAALSVTVKNLIPLERQAFNLGDAGEGSEPEPIEGNLPARRRAAAALLLARKEKAE